MAEQTLRKIPEWLSLKDVVQAWSEESGDSAVVLEDRFRAWFKEFLIRNAYVDVDSGNPEESEAFARLLEGRQIWRETFETFCEEQAQAKPLFWFPEATDPERRVTEAFPQDLVGQGVGDLDWRGQDRSSQAFAAPPAMAQQAPGAPNVSGQYRGVSVEEIAIGQAAINQTKTDHSAKRSTRNQRQDGRERFAKIALTLAAVAFMGAGVSWVVSHDKGAVRQQAQQSDVTSWHLAEVKSLADQPPANVVEFQADTMEIAAPAVVERAVLEPVATLLPNDIPKAITVPVSALEQVDEGLVFMVERELRFAGFDAGSVDGKGGPKLADAISDYQRSRGLTTDGRVSYALLSHLAQDNLKNGRSAPFLTEDALGAIKSGTADAAQNPRLQTAALQSPSSFTDELADAGVDTSLVASIQERLAARGYYEGSVDGRLGRKTQEAIKTYQRAQRYEVTGRPSRALFEELEDYSLEIRGLRLFRNGAYDRAIAVYSKIIKRQPKNANAFFNRGLAYKNTGHLELAAADYSTALSLDPMHRKAYLDRGNIRYQRGDYRAAMRDYLNALSIWLGLS